MNRLLRCWLAVVVGTGSACAHVEPPSGGPEDKERPEILTTRPDTLAVVPNWDSPVVLVFNERISERGIEDAVLVSPRTSPVQVERGSDEIRVSLRRGWQPGIIYHVTVRPVVQDLFNNTLARPVSVVFSTGPAIPNTALAGSVVDRITGKGEPDIRVEAILRADSLVYAVPTDSAGGFAIPHIPTGSYLVRAFRDINRNRALDSYEPRDTTVAEIAATDSASVQLSVVAPDSTPAKLASASLSSDSIVELRFDDYLDPSQSFVPAQVQIVDTTGVFVPVASVALGREGGGAPALSPRDTAATGAATPDTARAPAPPAAELPSQTLVVELAAGARLTPGMRYRATVRDVRNVVGLVGSGETTFQAPAAAPGATRGAFRSPARATRLADRSRTSTSMNNVR